MRNYTYDHFGSTPWLNAPWHDALTGALTRQHFLELLAEERVHAAETGLPFVLWIADIDALRNVNDRWGQQVGDTLLAAASQRLRELLAHHPWHHLDACYARFDGDSFILLARECDLDHGRRLAEAYRQRMAGSPAVDQISVSVCIGATQHRAGESVDELLGRTERTLHLAKQFGPDRVEIAKIPPSGPRRANVVPLRSRQRFRG